MNLINQLSEQLKALDKEHLTRKRRVVDSPCAPRIIVDGRPILGFASNDYLGLASHPLLAEALAAGARQFGTGSGASHMISGHSRAHEDLEARFAAFMDKHIESARALYFCTGYMANLAVLTALGADKDAEIFSEELNHASLIDGARLAKASVKVYPHADLEALRGLLAASTAATKLVVTDGVFSMDGNIAPLTDITALCEQHGAWLVIDDAHGFGVLGQGGRGVLEHLGLKSPNIVYIGTLGKAAGVGGAFVAAHATVIEFLVQRARPYIYTTAPSPALAHALQASLDLIGGAEGRLRRAHLQELVAQLEHSLQLKTWRRLPSATAIQPILIGANEDALQAASALYGLGLWVPAIRPPTVPAGTARLRITLSAAHTHDDVAELVNALHTLEGN